MKREEIIKYLDFNNVPIHKRIKYLDVGDNKELYPFYEQLKSCIKIKFHFESGDGTVGCDEVDTGIDDWFRGVIQSLYYRPNHHALILCGQARIGKTEFFRRLVPQKEWYCESVRPEFMFNKLICNLDEGFLKYQLSIVEKDDFEVRYPYTEQITCDKRLMSYCCATNFHRHPRRNNFIVLNVESINWEMYNSIDKHLLWIEIFNKFKP